MKRSTTLLLLLLGTAPAAAWEADTTHAGLTEGAALASRVNARLRAQHGRAAGWLELLTVAPDRAAQIYKKLGNVEPASGVVPDRRGRQSALAWLVAGAVLEGIPGDRDRNHFYDPVRKRGLSGAGAGLLGKLRGESDVPGGAPAPDWLTAKDNDMGLGHFWSELEQSVSAPTRVARDEHLALALVDAGAMLHVLQDMGAPSHVRDDMKEHLSPLGGGPNDRGSRFERLAAFVYGRLGVPAPAEAPARAKARDFFTAGDGKGLADRTNARWYSAGTLPGEIVIPVDPGRGEVLARVIAAQRYPSPKPERDLRLGGVAGPDGHVLRDDDGVCMANYHVEEAVLEFAISDACAAEQLAAILPEVGGYSVGFLEWLFRGALTVTVADGKIALSVAAGDAPLGRGQLTFMTEDGEGRRSQLASLALEPGQPLPSVVAPAGAKRIVVLFKGTDAAGEELIAAGISP